MKKYLLFVMLAACGKNLPPTPIPAEPNRSNIVAQPPPPPQQAALQPAIIGLCWDPSPSPNVTAYRLYQDGVKIQELVANRAQVAGLQAGTLYAFYVTAVGTMDDGSQAESDPSNTLKYIVPVLSIDSQGVHFTVPEAAYLVNQTYQLETTTDLANGPWVPMDYTVTGTNALAPVDFTGPQRFFRVHILFGAASCP